MQTLIMLILPSMALSFFDEPTGASIQAPGN